MGGRGRNAGRTAAAIGDLPGFGSGGEPAKAVTKGDRRGKKATPSGHQLGWKRRLLYFLGRWFGVGVEGFALGVGSLVAITIALSQLSQRFAGESAPVIMLWFGALVVALCLAILAFLKAWFTWRRFIVRVGRRGRHAPVAVALCLGVGATGSWIDSTARDDLRQLQSLFGGSAETERSTIAHQIYARYRRSNLEQTSRMILRGMPYDATVREAGAAFSVSYEILMGIAATESSFLPRPSKDGGQGLFQITKPPREALDAAKSALGVDALDVKNDHRHNIYAGAATFRHYLEQMDDDLFLALLAYNIGPYNGGLRSVMRNYGARDYVTIQPYLKDLPRDYPIRVLSAALSYRLWTRNFGKLPRYEDGDNAKSIQEIGVPGLERPSGVAGLVAGLD